MDRRFKRTFIGMAFVLLLFVAGVTMTVLGTGRVVFRPGEELDSEGRLEILVTNYRFRNVVIHPRDYLFEVTCRGESGREFLLLPDPTVDWPVLDDAYGVVVRPGETVRLDMGFSCSVNHQREGVPTAVVYRWP